MLVASEPVQRVLSHQEPLLCAVPGDESHHWHLATLVALDCVSVNGWGDYVSPIPSWQAVKARNARGTSPTTPAPRASHRPANIFSHQTLPRLLSPPSGRTQTGGKNKANREGLFRRSRGPGGQCSTITGDHVKPHWGDVAFLRGRTDWSQSGLPRVTWPVGRGAGFRRRAAASPTALPVSTVQYGKREEARGAGMWPPVGAGRSSTSRPSLVHGLASVSPSRTGDRALEPPPASASIQVSQSSLSAFISTQSLGKQPPPP